MNEVLLNEFLDLYQEVQASLTSRGLPDHATPDNVRSITIHIRTAANKATAAAEKENHKAERLNSDFFANGNPWTVTEAKQLVEAFRAGETIAILSKNHGRTTGAIKSKLEKLGVL